MGNVGYACINDTLANTKPRTIVNRTMRLDTFTTKGLSYVGELALKNLQDLEKILKWNLQNNILFYRMSSDMFPWWSEYDFKDLPNWKDIKAQIDIIAYIIYSNKIRVTFHPGPFNKLASPNQKIVETTIIDINRHAQFMDLLSLEVSPKHKINIHIGGVYDDKQETINRFITHYDLLIPTARMRLTVENDDKEKGFSVTDLLKISYTTKTPIVFDYHHHKFCNDLQITEEQALKLAINTWPKDIKPIVHYSESRDDKMPRAHSEYIIQKVNTYGQDVDIMFEAKKKEQAVLKYRKQYIK